MHFAVPTVPEREPHKETVEQIRRHKTQKGNIDIWGGQLGAHFHPSAWVHAAAVHLQVEKTPQNWDLQGPLEARRRQAPHHFRRFQRYGLVPRSRDGPHKDRRPVQGAMDKHPQPWDQVGAMDKGRGRTSAEGSGIDRGGKVGEGVEGSAGTHG